MITLLCAVAAETACFLPDLKDARRLDGESFRLWRGTYGGKELLLGESGIGRKAATSATRRILDGFAVDALISFGFAGALVAEAVVGDVVLPGYFLSEAQTGEFRPDPRLLGLAEVAIHNMAEGDAALLTAGDVVGDPPARRRLAQTYGARWVDMESFWVAAEAAGRAPFLGVRAVSDGLDDRLPPVDRWGGRGGALDATTYLARRPGALVELARLGIHVRHAQSRLRAALAALLGALPGE